MYLAYASKTSDGDHMGSTLLHKDVTAAYNIALDVANLPDGGPGHALWHIWPAWSSSMLEKFIFEQGLASPDEGNPIHGQRVYLDENHIKAFAEEYKVKPFVIRQQKGQAVFIPPDCPHSVIVIITFAILVLTAYRYPTRRTVSSTPGTSSAQRNSPKSVVSRTNYANPGYFLGARTFCSFIRHYGTPGALFPIVSVTSPRLLLPSRRICSATLAVLPRLLYVLCPPPPNFPFIFQLLAV